MFSQFMQDDAFKGYPFDVNHGDYRVKISVGKINATENITAGELPTYSDDGSLIISNDTCLSLVKGEHNIIFDKAHLIKRMDVAFAKIYEDIKNKIVNIKSLSAPSSTWGYKSINVHDRNDKFVMQLRISMSKDIVDKLDFKRSDFIQVSPNWFSVRRIEHLHDPVL